MSLHTLANHLQSAGRGDDKVLVHMTKDEVGGLQSLAKAHGGSLTINPETGLAEAGFLSSLLPMVIGAGLMMVPGMQPLGAAALTGVGFGAAKGSLKEGLMAGLGAYGGAGLAGGLMGAGATTAAAGTGSAAVGGAGTTAATNAITPAITTAAPVTTGAVTTGAATNTGTGLSTLPSSVNTGFPGITPTPVVNNALMAPNQILTNASVPIAPVNAVPNMAGTDVDFMSKAYAQQAQALPAGSIQSTPQLSNFEKMQAGFKNVTSSGDKAWQFVKDNPALFLSSGVALAQGMRNKDTPLEQNQGMIRPYDFEYNQTGVASEPYSGSGERTYFNPVFTAKTPYKAPGPEYAADGGLMGLKYAVGGPVEQMSADNAISANQMYPQSQLQTPMYSNPMVQRPMPNNVISSGEDAPVDAYTGEARFASGGATPETTGGYKYDYNPQTQQFTQISAPKPVDTGHGFQGLISRAVGPYGMGMNGQPQGGFTNTHNQIKKQQQAAPATPQAPVVSGGIAPPAYQPQQMQSYQPLQQPIDIPAYQTPEQQLGLGGFYDYMNQQLGQQRYADGGTARQAPMNAKMAAVDDSQSKMLTQSGLLETIKAAQAGDHAAIVALQKAGYDMNRLNEYAGGGGVSSLGGYSDGGRLLRGPGDGVSDSIPAVIGKRQPARLADGEFVIPARIVSELGNGSTEAGAKRLYAMMDRVQKARGKTTGKGKVATNTKAYRYLPA